MLARIADIAAVFVAQAPPPRTVNFTSAKSYTVEWIIVAVVVGACVYAVCRPSRRN